MIFCVQGRATEDPKPPQTGPQRRNFMVAVDAQNANVARAESQKALEATGYSFISIIRVLRVEGETKDPAITHIVDEARRNGIGFAIYR